MEHPFLLRRTSVFIYWSVIALISAVQAVSVMVSGILPVGISATDALVFGFLLGALGLAIWFVTRYNNLDKASVVQFLTSHSVAALVFTFSWYFLSVVVSRILLTDPGYTAYLRSVFTARILFGFLFYIVLASVYYLFILYYNNKQKIRREDELQKQLREAELKALKSQINPHFLFNSLNSIASLTQIDPERAHQMVVDLSSFMRASLRNHQNGMVTLEEELAVNRLYLQIEKTRFGEMLNFQFDVPDHCRSCLLPNMLLQPLFENAIKYGVYESLEPVLITLSAKKSEKGLQLTVRNSFDPSAVLPKGEGVGLRNVAERLLMVYGSNQLLKIDIQQGNFTIELLIPE